MILDVWGVPDALTKQAMQLHTVWKIFIVAGIVVALIVYGLIAFAVIRYRRRDDLLPKQIHNRIGYEIAYTVFPLLLVVGLVVVTLEGIADTTARAADPDLVIDVVASQWTWDFDYRSMDITGDGDLRNVPELVVPVGAAVRFNVTSDDVIHSFWIPGFFYKRDMIPGQVQTFDVDMGDRTGTFEGKCAEFCGVGHAGMNFTLRIVTADEFDAWVGGQ